jgi:hypothetical protein
MSLRPFRDFGWGDHYALDQGAAALEIDVLGPAFGRVRREANRQDEIDQIHPAPDVASAALAAIPSAFALRNCISFADFL